MLPGLWKGYFLCVDMLFSLYCSRETPIDPLKPILEVPSFCHFPCNVVLFLTLGRISRIAASSLKKELKEQFGIQIALFQGSDSLHLQQRASPSSTLSLFHAPGTVVRDWDLLIHLMLKNVWGKCYLLSLFSIWGNWITEVLNWNSLVAVDRNLIAHTGDTGLIPGPRRFHMLQGSWARASQLLSLSSRAREQQLLKPNCLKSLCSTTREATPIRSPCAATREQPLALCN